MPATTELRMHVETTTDRPADLSASAYRYALVGLVLVAAVLRIWHLDVRGFWIDEGFTWGVTRLTWPEFLHGLTTRAGDMTVYYFLIKLWSALGTSEFALRAFSVMVGIATVPVVAEVGKILYSRRAGIIAAALFTFHVYAIYYDREARPYGLVLFLAALSWLLLARIVRDPQNGPWFWFAIVSILEINSQLISGLNLAAQFVTLFFVFRARSEWNRVFRASLLIILGLLPAGIFTLVRAQEIEWVRPPDSKIFFEFLDAIGGRTGSVFQIYGTLVIIAAIAVLFALSISKLRAGPELWANAVPAVGFLFPVLALLLVSLVRPEFVPRYLIFTLLPLLWGTAALCSRLKSNLALVAGVLLAALLARALPEYYREPSLHDFRGAVQYIAMRQRPGDAIMIFEPMARPAAEYYLSRLPAPPEIIFPRPSRTHFMPEDMLIRPDPYTLPNEIAKRDHIWILYKLDKDPEEYQVVPALFLKRTTLNSHRLISAHQFRNIRVEEFGK